MANEMVMVRIVVVVGGTANGFGSDSVGAHNLLLLPLFLLRWFRSNPQQT